MKVAYKAALLIDMDQVTLITKRPPNTKPGPACYILLTTLHTCGTVCCTRMGSSRMGPKYALAYCVRLVRPTVMQIGLRAAPPLRICGAGILDIVTNAAPTYLSWVCDCKSKTKYRIFRGCSGNKKPWRQPWRQKCQRCQPVMSTVRWCCAPELEVSRH
jgi:hypothetical protein